MIFQIYMHFKIAMKDKLFKNYFIFQIFRYDSQIKHQMFKSLFQIKKSFESSAKKAEASLEKMKNICEKHQKLGQ